MKRSRGTVPIAVEDALVADPARDQLLLDHPLATTGGVVLGAHRRSIRPARSEAASAVARVAYDLGAAIGYKLRQSTAAPLAYSRTNASRASSRRR